MHLWVKKMIIIIRIDIYICIIYTAQAASAYGVLRLAGKVAKKNKK